MLRPYFADSIEEDRAVSAVDCDPREEEGAVGELHIIVSLSVFVIKYC